MINRLMMLWLMSGISVCSANELPVDLNGFRLWQYKSAAENHFGKPFQTMKRDDHVLEAHQVSKSSYMVFEYGKTFPENAGSIQITGYPTKMIPFMGLQLGDSEEKVISVLGKPSSTKKITSPPVTIWYYDKKNYTTEFDQQGRLYTIKIHLDEKMMNEADMAPENWAAFKQAILAKDKDTILKWLRPDVEISWHGRTLSIDKRFADFQSAPDRDFMEALIGDKSSVHTQIRAAEPEVAMRLMLEMGAGWVYKFHEDNVLAEIVFFPYNGQFRVYEVKFRN